MIPVAIRSWAAWAPGHEEPAAWQRWAASPTALPSEGAPAASFLPAMLRRRCSPLARMMLTAAFDCCPEAERADVATVFASRHGNINESVSLFERLARGEALSPTRFSHTVHNAQAGLFSIAAGSRQASSSLSAGEESFACGFLEALTFLEREPGRAVLLVTADAPLCDSLASLVEEPRVPYAVALLLAAGDGTASDVRFGTQPPNGQPAGERPWPDALEFLRWHLAGGPNLVLASGIRRWIWKRAA